jgi:NAD(P)-dependent dehydrogenase (short-subunit alcohol dehydrogenase family)
MNCEGKNSLDNWLQSWHRAGDRLRRHGAQVIVTYYKSRQQAESTRQKCLELSGADGLLLELNVKDDASINRCVRTVVATYGKIDVLVNNAGTLTWMRLSNQTTNDIKNQVRTNLEGAIKMTRACLPYVTETIINIGSIAGKKGIEELTVCCATKFGIRGFTQALAMEEPNIRIYSVNPDYIATRMTDFVGRPAEDVARVVVRAAQGGYAVPSGSDIDVWDASADKNP